MKVIMSKEGKILHDNLIDSMSSIDYINFDKLDGKNKIFHITISSKKIKNIFNDLLNYVSYIPCDFIVTLIIFVYINGKIILGYFIKNIY